MSAEKLEMLMSTTATRLTGVAHTLRHLAEGAQHRDTNLEGTCYFLADAIEQSVKEIDETVDGVTAA